MHGGHLGLDWDGVLGPSQIWGANPGGLASKLELVLSLNHICLNSFGLEFRRFKGEGWPIRVGANPTGCLFL